MWAAVRRLLEGGVHLLTLVGPTGVGKPRLSGKRMPVRPELLNGSEDHLHVGRRTEKEHVA